MHTHCASGHAACPGSCLTYCNASVVQGESASAGQNDSNDVVARVIHTVIRCGESAQESMQLAVVRALLTFTTAEHFIAHGECLLAAVRMVFNLALAPEDELIKRTANNALLQVRVRERGWALRLRPGPALGGGSRRCGAV